MSQRSYFRPLSLAFGSDARALVSRGDGGALGGMGHIAFSCVEVIERSGGIWRRSVISYREVASDERCKLITRERPTFAGLELNITRVMGIVNVTPDSFSDGGKLVGAEAAIAHGQRLLEEGADILDVGGESTRPGSDAVTLDDELNRVLPVISGLSSHGVVSVDTRKAAVMGAAARAGARIINDVSALAYDEKSVVSVAALQLPVIIMHAQGEPKTMQLSPRYDDVALDVFDYLQNRIDALVAAGIARTNIMVDPGIGFGKSYRHNLDILGHLSLYHGLGVPLVVGLSRKAVVGMLTGEKIAANRGPGSVGGALHAAVYGAHVLRVHDVKQTSDALRMFWGAMDPDSIDV
jgi:dihydropteroate synthase